MPLQDLIKKEPVKLTLPLPAALQTLFTKSALSFWAYHEKIAELIFNEIFEQQIYQSNIEKDSPFILDCGANIGLSVIYFSLVYPKATIHAFEPDPETFELLKRNLELNNISNTTLHNAAVHTANGPVKFFINPNIHALPLMSLQQNQLAGTEISVAAISMANFIQKHPAIDLCKMDVEGAEGIVIPDLFKKNLLARVNEWIIEYHPWYKGPGGEEFTGYFEQSGFKATTGYQQEKHPDYSVSGNTVYRFNFIGHE